MATVTAPHRSIADAAVALGISPDTLRYYEREDLLLAPVDRAPSGHRRYSDDDLGWIVLVTRLRSTGMSIRNIHYYAGLCRAGDRTKPQRLEILRSHRKHVLAELARASEHLKAIEFKIDYYERELSDDSCLSATPEGPAS